MDINNQLQIIKFHKVYSSDNNKRNYYELTFNIDVDFLKIKEFMNENQINFSYIQLTHTRNYNLIILRPKSIKDELLLKLKFGHLFRK